MKAALLISIMMATGAGEVSAGPLPATDPGNPARPNIILINVDDLGWKDLGYMDSDYYETPNIDRLAGEGMVFTNAYASAANCAPSRAGMLSGRYGSVHGIYTVGTSERGSEKTRKLVPQKNRTVLADSFYTMAEMLRDNGYRTGIFGKWHLGDDARTQGFDVNVGGGHHGNPGKEGYFSPYNIDFITDGPPGEYLTDRLTNEAISFMEDTSDQPFFLYLPYYSVHTPIMGKEALVEKFADKPGIRGQDRADYAAMIYSVDQNVGRILSRLRTLGLEENTLVIFTTDNGGVDHISDQDPLRAGKGSYYEGGIRNPLIIKWPAKIAPGKSDYPVINLDLYPTLAAVVKPGKKPDTLDGTDLSPLLFNGSRPPARNLFWHFPIYLQANGPGLNKELRDPLFRTRPGSVVRSGVWKLHEYFEDGELELYNLETDPGERHNLADSLPAKANELHRLLIRWRQARNAPVPDKDNPAFDPAYEKKQIRDMTQAARPNFLFLVIEDTSPYLLPAYGNQVINTPNIDFLAKNGVVFTNANSNAPYCSPSRSALISSCYPTSYGTDWHRNDQVVPDNYFFPEYLREAGYFTVNAGKTDYNITKEIAARRMDEVWNRMSGYRKPGKANATYNDPSRGSKPFFAQFNNSTTHMSRMTTIDLEDRLPLRHVEPQALRLPPHVPDLKETRADYALHLEGVEAADKWVGNFLNDLREKALLENTIIFFFSDHGGCLPRGKAFPYVTGTRPALIVYAPEKWQHLLPSAPGSVSTRLVEFTDLGATLLSISGVQPPSHMQGKPFMGKFAVQPRKYSFGFRTNTAYHFDPSRVVRNDRFYYIKYYTPYKTHGLRQPFQWGMPANLAWDSLFHSGKSGAAFRQHFQPKPPEMLFDLQNDPFCMHNLAADPAFGDQVREMRAALAAHIAETKDLGFFPLDVRNSLTEQGKALYDVVRSEGYDLELLQETAFKASLANAGDLPYFTALLSHERPEIRFWACSGIAGLAQHGAITRSPDELYEVLESEVFSSVIAVAAEALAYTGEDRRGLRRLISELEKGNEFAISSLEELAGHSPAGRVSPKAMLSFAPELKRISSNSPKKTIRFGARSVLIDLGASSPGQLFESRDRKSFITGHRNRVENFEPTLP